MKDISSTSYQQLITYKGAGTEKKIGSSFFRGKTGVQLNPYKTDYDKSFTDKYCNGIGGKETSGA